MLLRRPAVERQPLAPTSDTFDLASCLTAGLAEGAQEIVGHIRGDPVAHRTCPIEVGQQKTLHLLAWRTAGDE